MKKLLQELREFNETIEENIDLKNIAEQLTDSDDIDLSEAGEQILAGVETTIEEIPGYSDYGNVAFNVKGEGIDFDVYQEDVFYEYILDELDEATEYDNDNTFKFLFSYLSPKTMRDVVKVALEDAKTTILDAIGIYGLEPIDVNKKLCYAIRR